MMSFLTYGLLAGLAITFTAALVWLIGSIIFKVWIDAKPLSTKVRKRARKFRDVSIVALWIGITIVCFVLICVVIYSGWQAL